jgi:hypothetical protein
MQPPSPPIASAIAKNDSNPIRINENSHRQSPPSPKHHSQIVRQTSQQQHNIDGGTNATINMK